MFHKNIHKTNNQPYCKDKKRETKKNRKEMVWN